MHAAIPSQPQKCGVLLARFWLLCDSIEAGYVTWCGMVVGVEVGNFFQDSGDSLSSQNYTQKHMSVGMFFHTWLFYVIGWSF